MTTDDQRRLSQSDQQRSRAAWHDALPVVAVLAVAAVSTLLSDPDKSTAWNVVWVAASLAAAVALVWAQVRSLGRADEYQRTKQLQAFAVGFAAIVLLTFAGGLLQALGVGESAQWLQVSFIGGVLAWCAALAVNSART